MKMLVTIALVCVTISVSLVRLEAETNDPKPTSTSSPATDGCTLSLLASHQAYRFDQPISLQLVLKNEGSKVVKTMRSSLMQVYRFDVQWSSGASVPLTLEGKRQEMTCGLSSVSGSDLEPGKSTTDLIPMLNRLYDMTKLGEYSVTVYRKVWTKDGKSVEVASNTIKIKVTDEDVKATDTNASDKDTNGATSKPSPNK